MLAWFKQQMTVNYESIHIQFVSLSPDKLISIDNMDCNLRYVCIDV